MKSTETPGPLPSGEISALVALLNNDHCREAEERARALLSRHPAEGILWKIHGVALLRQGKDAEASLRKTAELRPQDPEAHTSLGEALNERRQWAPALASLRRAIELEPRNTDALVGAGDSLRALRQPGEAVPFYQQALQLNPRLLEAHNNLGNAFLELGRYDEAASRYLAALAISPDEPDILCNLGNVLRHIGRLPEALSHVQRAITLAPNSSAAHNTLGMIQSALKQPGAAIQSYQTALTRDPGSVDALNNLGSVLRDIGDRHGALRAYARAVQVDPRRAESHCNLGSVLLELRRIEEAGLSYRQALALQPGYALAHLGLSSVHRMQADAAAAEASCRMALSIQPEFAEALTQAGELCADRGEFAAAEQLFQRALAINPTFVPALNGIAQRKMTAADADWQRQAQAALAVKPVLADEITLRFALGKFCDDLGQYDAAFNHFRHANELTKRYTSAYDPAVLTRRVDDILQRFPAASIPRGEDAAADSQTPVFIVGMPRSGTSLTEQILASHPLAFGAGELAFWEAAFSAGLAPGPELAQSYLQRLPAQSRPAARVIDKMPANFLYAGLIHATLPGARIIHVRRHPLDTCLSIYFQNFVAMGAYANDLGNLAHFYGEYLRITNYWSTVLPPHAWLEVPYEALVADQEGWTRRMLAFLELPWDPACLDFQSVRREVLTASRWQVRQKINMQAIGRWQHYRDYLGPLAVLEGRA